MENDVYCKMVNNKVVENLISFPESPGSLFLISRTPVMSETSSYCLWHSRCIVKVDSGIIEKRYAPTQ